MTPDELLGTQIATTHPRLAKRFPRLIAALSTKEAAVALHATQAVASAATFMWPKNRKVKVVGGAVLASVGALEMMRTPYGGDGADQLQQVINVTLASTATFADSTEAQETAMRALAVEATIAYFASGVVKIVSPVWLSGDAFTGIIGTQAYGDEFLFSTVSKYPALGRLISWGTVAAEIGFPLIFVLPKPFARAYVGMMAIFHVGIGQFMGLNRFVLAFGATHPALLYAIEQRSIRTSEGLPSRGKMVFDYEEVTT